MKIKSKKVRKRPITAQPLDKNSGSTSHQATQQTISKYHVLLKRKAVLEKQLSSTDNHTETREKLEKQLEALNTEFERLGGIEAYQKASVHGQSAERGGDSAKVLIGWLKERILDQISMPREENRAGPRRKLSCLEIGALMPDNLASCSSWLDNHPIDLHSLHPQITEQDFFKRPLPESDEDRFDIISCSLVLNFVDEPTRRGHMLRLIHRHLLPRSSSLLFLVLPLPCVRNSRYMTMESLRDLMRCVGFEQVEERWKEGGKVAYWLYRWAEPVGSDIEPWRKKTVVNGGVKRNNFAILFE